MWLLAYFFWIVLSFLIPAALLYPVALWISHHSNYDVSAAYLIAVVVLFFPTAFLVDFLYRRFILKKRANQRKAPI